MATPQSRRIGTVAAEEKILPTGNPKNLRQGVTDGVGIILSAAIGAAGAAVLAPVVGATMGAERKGIVGGVLGFGGGAVAGVVGAAGIAVVGAVSGVVQVGKGVAAVPQQVVAPMRGKWWNEEEGRWVWTDMGMEAQALQDVPADDSDILGAIMEDLDQGHTDGSLSAEVADTYLYDALEVTPDASQATIKRRYYVLARQYHPDKNPDDLASAEHFKRVAEAYHVLSDPSTRKIYNAKGRDFLKSKDPTQLTPIVDAKTLYAFLFGSDKFRDIFGTLATATATAVGDSEKITAVEARKLQKRRVTRLAISLIERVTPWVKLAQSQQQELKQYDPTHAQALDDDLIVQAWTRQAEDLSKTSFGHCLVQTVGQAYYLVAAMYEGSLESGQGLPSLSKWISGKKAKFNKQREMLKQRRQQLTVGLQMMDLQYNLQKEMAAATTDHEREQIARDAEEAAVEMVVRALWTTTVVDITSTLHETCHMLFFDQSVDKSERKLRAQAIRRLGKIWMEIPEPPESMDSEKNLKQMYEEAAFAAVTETLRRKEEGAETG